MNIYDLLNKIIINNKLKLSHNLFTQNSREELDECDRPLFDILKNISSFRVEILDLEIKFHPRTIILNEQQLFSFSIDDITENDYKILKDVDLLKVPLILRVLIADILWTQKKEFEASKIAAKSYWELFLLWYSEESNVMIVDMVKRAVCISVQTNQPALYSEIYSWFNDFFTSKRVYNKPLFTLRVMEFFSEQKNYDTSDFLSILDGIIFENNDNVSIVEQSYELKRKCLCKLKKKEEATNNNIALAKYYIDFGEKILKENIQSCFMAADYFHKAIMLYRSNGEPQQAEKIHKRLVEIQKDIPKTMIPIFVNLDISDTIEKIQIIFNDLTFEESIIRLTQMIDFDKRDDIKNSLIEDYKSNPLSYIFGINLINATGQTILSLKPLDINDIEKDKDLLELYMHQNMLKKQQIIGDIYINKALQLIREKFVIDNSMLEFLVKNNGIIPKGRERIFQNAIGMFLRGEYYEAMHILAPQTENLFRNIAREVGGLTVTLENDGSSMEKVLSSIFNLPEILDCYDNDILFLFKGLLNEQAGANIRNKIAHGIINEARCASGACLYFGAAVIKLLTYTSSSCYEIFRDSDKLEHFEIPSEDDIKIQK